MKAICDFKDNPYFDYFEIKKQHDRKELSREELLQEFAREKEEMKPYMQRYENPFMNIQNFDRKFLSAFSKGDSIVIQEKIDGSNTHIKVSEQGFQCFSNNYILNEKNHLQGFWYWCRDHYRQVPEKYFCLDIYGEWLVPHHCEYPNERYGELYVFDVMENESYWPQEKVEKLADACGFCYAPVLYQGTFEAWADIMPFVGQTKLGGEKGEGVVVKNQTTLNSTAKQFYMKVVDVEFQETNKSRQVIKTIDMEQVLREEQQYLLSQSVITLSRVRKIILKLIDDGELSGNWKIIDEHELLKKVKPLVYRDCMKEEKEIVDKVGKPFGIYCNNLTLQIIKQMKEA